MASFTIHSGPWPAGTVVPVYLGAAQPMPGAQPSGPAQDSGTVTTAGSVTFANLAGGLSYVAYALGLSVRFLVPGDTVTTGGGGGGGGSGEVDGRVLLWDSDLADYAPAEWRVDTSVPREFVGPSDPNTMPTVVGPVYGDRWTPTAPPA